MRFRFVVLLLILLLLTSPVAGRKKKHKKSKRGKPAKQENITVTITTGELCLGCMTLIEDFNKEVIDRMEWAHKHAGKKAEATLDGGKIGREICGGERFGHYKESVQYACRKLVADNWKQIIKPMAGTISNRAVNQKRKVLESKKTMCTHPEVKACTVNDFEKSSKVIKNEPCEACIAVVDDIEFLLLRERTIKKERLSLVMDSLCPDIGMRHESTSYLEEVCEDILDDVKSDVVTQIQLHSSLTNSGFKPTHSLGAKVCREITSYCPSGEKGTAEL
jgi:hypothetical protein